MARVKWDASGGTTMTMSPGDNKLSSDQSDPTDARFGGHREHSQVSDAKDYTGRTGAGPNEKENPVDDVIRDIDDMVNTRERKNEFSYQEGKINVQKGNESDWMTKSDSDRLPPEDTDAFEPDPSDPNFLLKTRRSKLKYHFGDGQYSNPHSDYEGEIT